MFPARGGVVLGGVREGVVWGSWHHSPHWTYLSTCLTLGDRWTPSRVNLQYLQSFSTRTLNEMQWLLADHTWLVFLPSKEKPQLHTEAPTADTMLCTDCWERWSKLDRMMIHQREGTLPVVDKVPCHLYKLFDLWFVTWRDELIICWPMCVSMHLSKL